MSATLLTKSFSPSQAASELLARRTARTSLERYIEYLDVGVVPADHHRALIAELEAVERREVPRLIVCMPPGSAKSTYASHLFPAWYLGKHPERGVIGASHGQDLADEFGRRVRNFFVGEAHQNVFSCPISPDSQAAGRWETSRGGRYHAAGIGSSITGRRADLGIIDDPIKSREDADSDRVRQRIWDWYTHDFVPRLKPGSTRLLITTRWHEDDLAGRLLDREPGRWKILSLPMEATIDDPLGRAPGERLWPEWFTEEMVEDAKADPRAWNALYQQQPAAEEGDYFKLAWFGEYDGLPGETVRYGASDYAATDGGGDYTEHGIFAVDAWSNIYVLDWWRGQTATDEWIERQCDLILRHTPQCWFGESGPIRRAIEPFLVKRMTDRRAFCRVEWLPSIGDKASRCRPFQALSSMGKVMFPKNAPWKADLIGQLLRFPAGRHDDGVDVCSLIGRGLEHIRPPKIARPVERKTANMTGGPSNRWMAG